TAAANPVPTAAANPIPTAAANPVPTAAANLVPMTAVNPVQSWVPENFSLSQLNQSTNFETMIPFDTNQLPDLDLTVWPWNTSDPIWGKNQNDYEDWDGCLQSIGLFTSEPGPAESMPASKIEPMV